MGFEGLTLGQRFPLPSRTVLSAHFSAFQALSGDNHPIHYDRRYCAEHGHRDLLAHGLQVGCFAASGAGLFPHLVGDALIGFLEQSSRFRAPVYLGDTLSTVLEVVELRPQRTTGVVVLAVEIRNQDGVVVLEGRQSYLLRLAEGGR
ncbi:MAG: dehydratase [Acidobacteria bacterium]|nr:MAG: dehydratase [Acidobacteriota bacterium]REK11367.1 MAG: dehydratase [Acidobacteriota bacterium]